MRKALRRALAFAMIVGGTLAILWGVGSFAGLDFPWGGRHTPAGRDAAALVLLILIGLCLLLWGLSELPNKVNRTDRSS